MTHVETTTARATAALGEWGSALRWSEVPAPVAQRLRLVLIDVLGVMLVGAREPEQQRLAEAWDLLPGPSPVVGGGRLTSVESAAWLNAAALVRLELDEGNKYAKDSPAAHGFPAVLALASAKDSWRGPPIEPARGIRSGLGGSDGPPRCARTAPARLIEECPAPRRAVPASCASMVMPPQRPSTPHPVCRWLPTSPVPWTATGSVTRGWGRQTSLGCLPLDGSGRGGHEHGYGGPVPRRDPGHLRPGTAGRRPLGERWDVEVRRYFKQRAACSFTHPAADAVIALRESGGPAGAPPRSNGITVEDALARCRPGSPHLDQPAVGHLLHALASSRRRRFTAGVGAGGSRARKALRTPRSSASRHGLTFCWRPTSTPGSGRRPVRVIPRAGAATCSGRRTPRRQRVPPLDEHRLCRCCPIFLGAARASRAPSSGWSTPCSTAER